MNLNLLFVPLNEEWSIFSMEHLWLDWLLNLSSVKDWLRRLWDFFWRSPLPPPAASSKGQHEITIPAGLPQYCFDGLSPDALYTATVFVQTSNLEGPGVGIKERTRECFSRWTFLNEFLKLVSVRTQEMGETGERKVLEIWNFIEVLGFLIKEENDLFCREGLCIHRYDSWLVSRKVFPVCE